MVPELRARFNAQWTEAKHARLTARLHERCAGAVDFPFAETPCFFPRPLLEELSATAKDLVAQTLAGDGAIAAAHVVPDRFRGAAASEPHPTFLQVDFGFVRDDHRPYGVAPKLVELQAFPSLYGFQVALAESYREVFDLPADCTSYLDDLTAERYHTLLQQTLVGAHDPSEVVLMEIDPQRQKTRPDFALTEQLWGVRAVDTADVVKDGGRLLYRRHGQLTPIRRVYNRVIPDELERKGLSLPFAYRDDLEVEWLGHPEWYFRVSKFSIPWLRHESVPRTWFLADVPRGRDDSFDLPLPREQLLLKPLFSFAGGGIVFAPTAEQLTAIPVVERGNYIVQERMTFAPVIDTPHGATQVEIRIMLVWTDRVRAVLPLLRLGRGKMMGVDHNKGLRWVGASAGFLV